MEMRSQENGEMMYGLGITNSNRGLDFFLAVGVYLLLSIVLVVIVEFV